MDQHDVIGRDGILVDFHDILAVLLVIGLGKNLGGQFPRLSQRNETRAESHGKRRGQHETARLDSHHLGNPFILV